ncbi:hypothetical protein CSKR_105024 [Clonorchis sinensis]|uniref:Uncharacterized protein n=1 Tax=Clonorchis sinensis TaxID=79923 RepID=A0A3R7EUA6_CLOSI|nr:hypothetical protein CSKR_105024 [Clonorchis sinensis]
MNPVSFHIYTHGCNRIIITIIIIIDSMTVFNTDASLPYNQDLFESLIVKERIKKLTRTPLTSVGSHTCSVFNRAQWGSRGPHPGMRVAPTALKRFVISFIPLCQVKGWPPLYLRHYS